MIAPEADQRNYYFYAADNPLIYVDPEGLFNIRGLNRKVEKELRKEMESAAPGRFNDQQKKDAARATREEMSLEELGRLNSDKLSKEQRLSVLQGIFNRLRVRLEKSGTKEQKDLLKKCEEAFFKDESAK